MLDLTKQARKFLETLPPKQFKQVGSKMISLLREPYPNDCKHLSGHPGFRRVDIGEYRICYTTAEAIIRIAVAGKRNDDDVYNQLKQGNS